MRGVLLLLVLALLGTPLAATAQDRDGDGVLDDADLCPELAEGDGTLFPGDGCPDVDSDGDRVVDDHDACPADRETVNGFEDADGCPDTEGASAQRLADRVHFATGSDQVDRRALVAVARLAAWLASHPEAAHVQIVARADAGGAAETDETLALRRATNLRQALVERGVASTRLTARGLGALPLDTVEARTRNRVVEVHVALAGNEHDAMSLDRFAGLYSGDAALDVGIGASARDTTVTLHPTERGARLVAYAGHVVGDRLILVLAGADREMTLVLRTAGDRAFGVAETRAAATVQRVAWTARFAPPFSQAAVVRAITEHRAAFQACYEQELRSERTLTGRITFAMTVQESGEVSGVRVATDAMTPPRPALGACAVAILEGFEFHPAPIGGSVSYVFPFVFEPQDTAPPAE